jgi:tryptophan halogenase
MKIVIVGGGTAGWLAATHFVKHTTGYDVTVIESLNIPIIGAGEGATALLPWFLMDGWDNGGIDEKEFIRKTKGTIKLAINLKNWKGDGKNFYSPIHASSTYRQPYDTAFLGSILKYDRADMSSIHSWLLEAGLTTYDKSYKKILSGLASNSYHFDGNEVGKYFKELCIKKGVKVINTEVEDTKFDENEYLKSITLKNGDTISADLWFDCTGFSRTLVGKTKNKWISFKENLPVNSAIPFSTPITSKTVRFETLAETMNAGWMWKIPLQERHGNGYVFCNEFQSFDKGVEELENNLGHSIDPIREIKFETGRYNEIWYKNIVSVGLSSHFLEPLQATSIHISILSLSNLLMHFLRDVNSITNDTNRMRYNTDINKVIDDYKDFIQMHYLAGRSDTPFWKFMKNEIKLTDRNVEYLEISKSRSLNIFDFDSSHGTPGWGVWGHIIDMVGLYNKSTIEKELINANKLQNAEISISKIITDFNKAKIIAINSEEFFKYIKI